MAALALPLVALTLVTVIEVRDALDAEHDVSNETQLARAATGPNGLFTNLQNERNRATVDLVGQGSLVGLPVADNAAAREATDSSLEEFESVVAEQGGSAEEVYEPALAKLDELEQIRNDIDANGGPFTLEANSAVAADIFTRYTDIVGELLSSNRRLSSSIENEDLRRGTDLSYMSSLQTDLLARLTRTLLLSISHGGLNQNEEIQEAAGLLQLATRNFQDIQSTALDEYGPSAERLAQAESNRGLLERIAPSALQTGQVNAAALLASVSTDDDGYMYTFRDEVKALLDEQADSLEADAAQRRNIFLALAFVVVAVAAAATYVVSRSITRPLRALTSQAADMAHHRLPEAVQDILDTPLGDDVVMSEVAPVTVKTNDEVSDVSEALNTVQDSALHLAVEQAVLRRNIADSFVNLGRRNQNLLSRQLDFITELEQNETDPEILGDLFRLDHLATRMRRNAESLLVLAGIDPPRQWAAPVRIQDVIRAALGEVEDFQRVTVRAVEPVTVLGSVAADLAHLIAELVENALVFSPQDQTVEVRGRAQSSNGYGGAEAYTLAIIDYGLGMRPEELERANRRLAGTESFTVAPSKYLGHYVAGNLAARHDIAITLHNSPGNGTDHAGHSSSGITALVRLPAAVLTTPALVDDGSSPAGEQPDLPDEPRELVGAGIGVGPGGPAAPTHTASGLARRTRSASPAPEPFALPTEMIEALEQHTRPAATPPLPTQPSPAWPSPPVPAEPAATPGWPAPAGPPQEAGWPPPSGPPTPVAPEAAETEERTASGLVRRRRGAQMPKTETVGLRRGTGETDAVPETPPQNDSLQNLLGHFTAGVQRGLDETQEMDRDDED